jgi:hypothetical protein
MTLGSTGCQFAAGRIRRGEPSDRGRLPRTFSVIPTEVEESLTVLLSGANHTQKCPEMSRLRST